MATKRTLCRPKRFESVPTAWLEAKLSPGALAAAIVLFTSLGRDTEAVVDNLGLDSIAEATGMSEFVCRKSINELAKRKVLSKKSRQGWPPIYTFLDPEGVQLLHPSKNYTPLKIRPHPSKNRENGVQLLDPPVKEVQGTSIQVTPLPPKGGEDALQESSKEKEIRRLAELYSMAYGGAALPGDWREAILRSRFSLSDAERFSGISADDLLAAERWCEGSHPKKAFRPSNLLKFLDAKARKKPRKKSAVKNPRDNAKLIAADKANRAAFKKLGKSVRDGWLEEATRRSPELKHSDLIGYAARLAQEESCNS